LTYFHITRQLILSTVSINTKKLKFSQTTVYSSVDAWNVAHVHEHKHAVASSTRQ